MRFLQKNPATLATKVAWHFTLARQYPLSLQLEPPLPPADNAPFSGARLFWKPTSSS